MFPNKPYQQGLAQVKSCKGFMIPLTLFILVGLGALAVAINRMSSQSRTATTLEGVSLQAFYAAESGAQYAMHQLLYGVIQRSVADINCNSMPATVPGFPAAAAAGLQACSITLSCNRATIAGNPKSFYTIQSTGNCGSGNLSSQRTVEVSTFM